MKRAMQHVGIKNSKHENLNSFQHTGNQLKNKSHVQGFVTFLTEFAFPNIEHY